MAEAVVPRGIASILAIHPTTVRVQSRIFKHPLMALQILFPTPPLVAIERWIRGTASSFHGTGWAHAQGGLTYMSIRSLEPPKPFTIPSAYLFVLSHLIILVIVALLLPHISLRQALLYGLLISALAQATPTRKVPSPIAKRGDPPKPSDYPGGDSTACTNEPQYLNFDISKSGDLKRVQKLHHVFCNEFNLLTIAGSTATNDADRTI